MSVQLTAAVGIINRDCSCKRGVLLQTGLVRVDRHEAASTASLPPAHVDQLITHNS